MLKATILYGHPADPDAFEKYYAETHTSIAMKIGKVHRWEFTKFLSAPDGGKAAFYRMAEIYFAGPAEMQEAFGSPEGQAATADLANFASGGVTMIVGAVQ